MRISKQPLNLQAPCRGELHYPSNPSEFEVQAFLYIELRRLGYDVRGEVMGHAKCRFDLVIYLDRKAVRIIEVKGGKCSTKPGTRCRDQIDRYYDRYGVPVDAVCGLSEAKRYLELVTQLVQRVAECDALAAG